MKKLFLIIILIFAWNAATYAQESDNYIKSELFLAKQEYQKAHQIINDILIKDTSDHRAHFIKGKIYQSQYKLKEALSCYNLALKFDNKNSEYLNSLGNIWSLLDNNENAIDCLKKSVLIDSTNISAHLLLGKLQMEENQFADAVNTYQHLIGIDSSNFIYYRNKGICLSRVNEDSKALDTFSEALSLNPEDINSSLYSALVYNKNKYTDSALAVINRAIRFNPKNVKLNRLAADLCFQKQMYMEAIAHYSFAFASGDSTFLVCNRLGISYYHYASSFSKNNKTTRDQKLTEAFTYLKKAEYYEPEDYSTALYIGLYYKDMEDYANAEAYLKMTLEFMIPEYIDDVYLYYGQVLSARDNPDLAINVYNKALEFNPDKPIAFYYLAGVYDLQKKDTDTALKYYKLFTENYEGKDAKLIEFAKGRIEKITESNFFNMKK